METSKRPFAIVTGASSGIGLELARCAVARGYDLLVAADGAGIHDAARLLRESGASVEGVQADLANFDGVDALCEAVRGRRVDALLANAGRGLGHAFLDQDFSEVRRVIDTNVTGTLYLIQKIGRVLRTQREGKILITGSIAGLAPGTYQAVYNGTKALLDSFAFALRAELQHVGVTVTCLMPGATETDFFERADMMDTRLATSTKMSPEEVARAGFEAMERGDAEVVAGWQNKLRAALSHLVPSTVLAEQHRKMAEPGGVKVS